MCNSHEIEGKMWILHTKQNWSCSKKNSPHAQA